ncbi:MAG: hypothetical protein IPJ61_08785 [Tessaracoccus sp.]|uniref:hypothetical protein n=1 Tax=Tessaracoccus sp. TaxID=1971211 RepID=UPI001EB9789E|nr:hypothetical protein [Tessaracoccus sp.]MBK7821155.1 hypothetical protein [Tessaracoccus sp.]
MPLGGWELAIVLVAVAIPVVLLVFWIMALVEVVRTPEALWKAAGQDRVVALLLLVLLPVVGYLIYLIAIRSKLGATAQR